MAQHAKDSGLEITIQWGEATLLVRHLSPPRPFVLGSEAGPDIDFVVPEEALGQARWALVQGAGDAAEVVIPGERGEERVKLGAGEARELRLGELTVRALGIAALPSRRTVSPRRIAWSAIAMLGLSALAHGGLLACSSGASEPYVEDGELSDAQTLLLQQYLASADEAEAEEKEAEAIAESLADSKEGGTGTRAKGEEGSMGSPRIKDTGSRFGVAGPTDNADPHIARQSSLQEAQEFGMIGLLNSGSGGDPNAPTAPWGRDDSLGQDLLSARGNQWGAEIGDGFGAGGLSGIGTGGGGRGEGLGLGNIGTIGHGAGTGTAQGFGNGSGRLGGSHRTASPRVSMGTPSVGGSPAPQAAPMPMEPLEVEAPLDPNGRYATTYRPGAGHLAAFDAAVAQGLLPIQAREVVSDLGGRFSPALAPREGSSLGVRVDLERQKLAPGGGAVHMRLSLAGTDVAPGERPHLSVHLVLDRSGSMEGASIERARNAAVALVERLAPTDDFSLTTFSDEAELLVIDGPVGPRRGYITAAIQGIRADGGTNIGEGLRLGYRQASSQGIPEDAVRVVMLLSDGQATAGETSPAVLSRLSLDAFQEGIQTSTFGVGSSFDGPLMSAIAGDGAGGYYYLADGAQIAKAFATELDRRLDPIATAVEVRVHLEDDATLLKVYGSRRLGEQEGARVRAQEVAADVHAEQRDGIKRDRKQDRQGGMRFFFPAFARGDSHAMLLKLRLPEGVGARKLALVEVKYKDRVFGRNVVQELPIETSYADGDAESAASIDGSVARTVQAFVAGESLLTAAQRVTRGDVDGAMALLSERESLLRTAATSLGEPRLATEADRLARLRSHLEPSGQRLALAVLLESAGRSRLQ